MNCRLRTATTLGLLLALQIATPVGAAQVPDDQTPGIIDLTPRPTVPDDSGFPARDVKTDTAEYKGRFKLEADGQITGSVSIDWKNGDHFEGHLLRGKRIGPGSFAGSDGQVYEGTWEDDQLQGKGRLRYANGDEYAGDLNAGLPDGIGSFTEAGGNRYEGSWKAGHKDGYGTYTWTNGQIYEGDWSGDQATGQGTLTQTNGNRYTGALRNGHPEGRGSMSFGDSGDRYEGDFRNGVPDGQGTYTWKNGDHYDGPWKMGQKSGIGRYTWPDGDYWEGDFVNDTQGEGRMYFTPRITVTGQEIRDLLAQTRTTVTAQTAGSNPGDADTAPEHLRDIPLVAAELRTCREDATPDCRDQIVQKIIDDRQFQHDWQALTREGANPADHARMEVDRHSILDEGNVFTWLRFSATDSARSIKAGIRYNCETESLDIQLIYRCLGTQGMSVCTLDPDIDAYAGKPIPATPITGWFDTACRRRFGEPVDKAEDRPEGKQE